MKKLSAPALMQAVYDGFTWVDSARTFHIRTDYKITHTEAERRWQDKRPQHGFLGGNRDFQPFHLMIEWAWEEKRISYRTQSRNVGETNFHRQTRIWDGSLALEHGESADKKHNHYMLGNKAADFFVHSVTPMELPWMPYGAHKVWWMTTDAAKERESHGVAPAEFELAGQEVVNGKSCHVLLSRFGHYRMHVGVADGRLYANHPGAAARAAGKENVGPVSRLPPESDYPSCSNSSPPPGCSAPGATRRSRSCWRKSQPGKRRTKLGSGNWSPTWTARSSPFGSVPPNSLSDWNTGPSRPCETS